MRVCLLTDLHLQPPAHSARLALIQQAVTPCDLVIYCGDILTMDSCHGDASVCTEHFVLARRVVDTIAKPFMFTLGNHDGEPNHPPRRQLQEYLAASTHHIGDCDVSLNACMHPTLGIATLDSGKNNCHPMTEWGCPSAKSAGWLDTMLATRVEAFGLLITHIPPPNVLGLRVRGVVGESICCWDEWPADDSVLPSRRPILHAFGHDHSNLFLSEPETVTGVRWRVGSHTVDSLIYTSVRATAGLLLHALALRLQICRRIQVGGAARVIRCCLLPRLFRLHCAPGGWPERLIGSVAHLSRRGRGSLLWTAK